MSKTFYADVIVLNRRDYTEYSHFYTVYTKDLGKISAICQGSKKIKSKLAPHLEGFNLARVFFVAGKRNYRIIGIDKIQPFKNIMLDYDKVLYATYCLELVDKVTQDNDKESKIHGLLAEALSLINEFGSLDYGIIINAFTYKLLITLGFSPQLYECIRCEQELKQGMQLFSIAGGGIICSACNSKQGLQICTLMDGTVTVLRMLEDGELRIVPSLGVSIKIKAEISSLIKNYLDYHVDRKIRSLALVS